MTYFLLCGLFFAMSQTSSQFRASDVLAIVVYRDDVWMDDICPPQDYYVATIMGDRTHFGESFGKGEQAFEEACAEARLRASRYSQLRVLDDPILMSPMFIRPGSVQNIYPEIGTNRLILNMGARSLNVNTTSKTSHKAVGIATDLLMRINKDVAGTHPMQSTIKDHYQVDPNSGVIQLTF